jgi:hypothetical protein
VLPVEAQGDLSATMQHMELATQPVAPWIRHSVDLDSRQRKVKMCALQLTIQDLTLLGQLLLVGEVLQLAATTTCLEIRARRIDSSLRRLDDRGCLGSPEILSPMRDLGFHGFARDRTFDEHHSAVDACHRRPAMGKLANRQLH